MAKTNVYEIITNQILKKLDQGVVPWRKPWKYKEHINLLNKHKYRGVNTLLLEISEKNDSPYWATFKQVVKNGGTIKKSECKNYELVIFWKWIEKYDPDAPDADDDGKIHFPILRYYRVYNVKSQTTGLEDKIPKSNSNIKGKAVDDLWDKYKNPPEIKYGGNRAFYHKAEDYVKVPDKDSFYNEDMYSATIFHELIHSTGHPERLDRPLGGMDDEYSKEELVAEMGAAFLCGHYGITTTMDNSAAYVKYWKDQLSKDSRMVVFAASQAQKAVDYVLGKKFENN